MGMSDTIEFKDLPNANHWRGNSMRVFMNSGKTLRFKKALLAVKHSKYGLIEVLQYWELDKRHLKKKKK